MEKVKIGIIGCGGIANGKHMPALSNLKNVEMVAFCDIVIERAEKAKKEYGTADARVYSDYNEMLAKEKLDAVSVTTWNAEHARATIAALNAGCNVICEKPMAMNTEEAVAMEKAAIKSGKLLQIGFVRRYGGDALSAKDFIDSGKAGDIFFARVSYERRNGCPGRWFADKKYSGGGPLIDLGVHVMDLARYLAGRPKPVSAYGVTVAKAIERDENKEKVGEAWHSETKGQFAQDVEDFATGFIKFDNGFVINVSTSFRLNLVVPRDNVEILGTKAGLILAAPTKYLLCDGTEGVIDDKDYPSSDFNDIFRAEMAHFIDCVRNGTECRAPAHDGVVLMQMIDALYESAATGKEAFVKSID